MICEKCNKQIGPEDLNCPHCGAANPFAQTHAKNMKEFEVAYKKTEKEVVEAAKKTGGWAKRAAILIALIVGIIVVNIIASVNYADPDEDAAARKDAEKNASVYAEEADSILESGDYTDYVSFLYAHELMNFPPEEFDRFRSVNYVAKEYYDCITQMERIILRSTDPDYFDSLDSDISIFCRGADSFYEVLDAQKESEKDPKYLAYIEDMETELEAAMKTYFVMDDAALKEFIAMPQGQKGLRLEEVLKHE